MSDQSTASINVGVSLQSEDGFLQAALPLFESESIDVLEYSFDTAWTKYGEPGWVTEVVNAYAKENQLLGHGVHFSALTGVDTEKQDKWLALLKKECATRPYRHLTEHFGFMTSRSFHDSSPLPVPMTDGALALGHARLQCLQETSGLPVGLENLGFALGYQDVREQGQFLQALLEPVGGFLLLDLHNLYCLSCNFKISMSELFDAYPMHLVKEMHVSGGSWAHPMGEVYRRDTHDGAIPETIFECLEEAIMRAPALTDMIYERLGTALTDPAQHDEFRDDFVRLKESVIAIDTKKMAQGESPHELDLTVLPVASEKSNQTYEDPLLYAFQSALMDLLWSDASPEEIHRQFKTQPVFQQVQGLDRDFDLRSIATAKLLIRKWGRHKEINPPDWLFIP